jgi:hypothetical protein
MGGSSGPAAFALCEQRVEASAAVTRQRDDRQLAFELGRREYRYCFGVVFEYAAAHVVLASICRLLARCHASDHDDRLRAWDRRSHGFSARTSCHRHARGSGRVRLCSEQGGDRANRGREDHGAEQVREKRMTDRGAAIVVFEMSVSEI